MAPKPIQLLKTAFVIYYHADLSAARKFFLDFGMHIVEEVVGDVIHFAGYGVEPFIYVASQSQTDASYFGGAAYVVDGRDEFQRATQLASCTGPARQLNGPAGGEIITLKDPAGHLVHLVHGWQEKVAEPLELEKLTINYEDEKPRKGRFQRFEPGPAPVFRWGHYGVTYPEGKDEEMFEWYTKTISLAPSDIVFRGEKPVTCFFHVDRGEEYADHHAFFFKMVKPGNEPAVAHAAFEVHDFDVQQLGHQHLTDQGYELCWGVGRVSCVTDWPTNVHIANFAIAACAGKSGSKFSCHRFTFFHLTPPVHVGTRLALFQILTKAISLTTGSTQASLWSNTTQTETLSIVIHRLRKYKLAHKHCQCGDHQFPQSSDVPDTYATSSECINSGVCI
jgi:hypothetical protein